MAVMPSFVLPCLVLLVLPALLSASPLVNKRKVEKRDLEGVNIPEMEKKARYIDFRDTDKQFDGQVLDALGTLVQKGILSADIFPSDPEDDPRAGKEKRNSKLCFKKVRGTRGWKLLPYVCWH